MKEVVIKRLDRLEMDRKMERTTAALETGWEVNTLEEGENVECQCWKLVIVECIKMEERDWLTVE